MNSIKYDARLPALRLSNQVLAALEARAKEQGITLAEAHRQMLGESLKPKTIQFIPKRNERKA